jgi:hypothetical protein
MLGFFIFYVILNLIQNLNICNIDTETFRLNKVNQAQHDFISHLYIIYNSI